MDSSEWLPDLSANKLISVHKYLKKICEQCGFTFFYTPLMHGSQRKWCVFNIPMQSSSIFIPVGPWKSSRQGCVGALSSPRSRS